MKKITESAEVVAQVIGFLLGRHFSTPIIYVTEQYTSMVIF